MSGAETFKGFVLLPTVCLPEKFLTESDVRTCLLMSTFISLCIVTLDVESLQMANRSRFRSTLAVAVAL